jgi:hypothetical protein
MSVPDARLTTYLKAFWDDWLSRMCGPLSVPFGAIAVWWAHAPSVKVLWAVLAVLAFFLASYRVWRSERNIEAKEVEKLGQERKAELERVRQESSGEIGALKAEIINLKRKPYDEELGRQGAALIAGLSPEGRILLRHLVTNEPVEIGRRFKPEIAQDVQDAQLAIAYASGIVRHDIVRAGSGSIVRQDYVLNPQFRAVLQDLLFNR